MAQTNVQAWKEFIGGNKESLLMLYELNYVGLLNYGSKFLNNRDHLNDHLMDLLLQLWDNRDKLPVIENVRSYLMTCFRRKLLNRNKQEVWEDSLGELPESQGTQSEVSFEERLIKLQSNEQIKNKLANGLKKLSPRQREMIELKFFKDLSYDEIAVKCLITKRTAYNIVHDALIILRKEMTDNNNLISFYEVGIALYAFSYLLHEVNNNSTL